MKIGTDRNVIERRREEPREPFLADRLLVCADSHGRGSGRRGLVASLVIHGLLVAGLIAVSARLPRKSEEPLRVDVVFYPEPALLVEPVPLPAAPEVDDPIEPAPVPFAPTPEIERPVIASEDRPPLPPTRPDPTPVPSVAEPIPLPSKPEPTVRTDVVASQPTPPAVDDSPPARSETRTNVFAEARAPATITTPPDEEVAVAHPGAFASDRTPALADRPGPVVLATTEVGAFEIDSPSPARPTPSGPPPSERVLVDAEFGGERASGDMAETRSPAVAVKQGGFGETVVVAQPRPARPGPAVNPDVPVEIVSKPRPAYTEQARESRVEGEVVLEVLFGASGRLRVIRVVRGLGHGLDDAAVEAARRIDFKPALRNGKPIDYMATLRVVFQLA